MSGLTRLGRVEDFLQSPVTAENPDYLGGRQPAQIKWAVFLSNLMVDAGGAAGEADARTAAEKAVAAHAKEAGCEKLTAGYVVILFDGEVKTLVVKDHNLPDVYVRLGPKDKE